MGGGLACQSGFVGKGWPAEWVQEMVVRGLLSVESGVRKAISSVTTPRASKRMALRQKVAALVKVFRLFVGGCGL